jgi:hypothetical protein
MLTLHVTASSKQAATASVLLRRQRLQQQVRITLHVIVTSYWNDFLRHGRLRACKCTAQHVLVQLWLCRFIACSQTFDVLKDIV